MTRPDKAAEPVADLVRRDFSAETVDEKWCGDLTEIPTGEGKLYLAIVEDLASRRLCGFAIGEHHDAALAKAALCMAGAVRGGDIDGVIFHSDKGGVSTPATSSPKHARRSGSPSRWAESPRLWTTRSPKASTRHWNGNCCHAAISPPFAQARREVARFIEAYNHTRRHSSCEMKPPVVYEQLLADRTRHSDTDHKRAA